MWKKTLITSMFIAASCINVWSTEETTSDTIIDFADSKVKSICVKYWDTNGDGELSMNEAAAVTTLNSRFENAKTITSFDELRYFSNLKIINKKDFYSCISLISITIPENVTTISDYAFNLCLSLDSITIPNSVTKIRKYAFYGCSKLNYVTLPQSNLIIEEFAFGQCENLQTVIINEGITSLYFVFSECETLETINIPESVVNLEGTFRECSNLKSIVIPKNVKKISATTFEGCYALENIVVDTENPVYDSRNNCNAIIEKGTNNLLFGSNNTTVVPDDVTSIADKAFYKREGLKEITLSSRLTSIGNQAFYNCEGLKEITLPSEVTFIGNNAFYGCNGLIKIVSEIEEPRAITAFTSTVKKNAILVVPQESKSKYETLSGWSDFLIYGDEEAAYLKKYTDNQGVSYKLEEDDSVYFYSVSGYDAESLLPDVSIPENIQGCVVRKIYAFNGAEKLRSVTLPTTLNYIGNKAFQDCSNLKRVYSLLEKPIAISSSATFPWSNAVLIVPRGALTDYKNASYWKSAIIFEEGDTIYEKIYTDAQGVKYTLNEGNDGFYYSVTGNSGQLPMEVVIPTNIEGCPVTAIASSAFKNCAELEKVVLPESLTSLYVNAFIGCTSLKEIVSRINDPSQLYVNEIKQEVYERAILRIPEGTKAAYLNSGLKYFFVYEEGEEVINHERYPIDGQGVKYQLAQTTSTFYYKVIGYTDELVERVTIPEEIDGVPVNALSGNAFKDCTGLKWISLPPNISNRYDAKKAFVGCSLALALNGERIRDIWYNSDFINELELGNDVDTLWSSAFKDCVNLTKVTFPEGLKLIGESAFSGCTNLKYANLPRGLTTINRRAFYNCKNLELSMLPDSLETLGDEAFAYCTNIDSVIVSEKLTMSGSPFEKCTGVKYIEIHSLNFGSWFKNLPNINKVYVGGEVETYNNGLAGCSGVEIIEVSPANKVFDSRNGCNAIIRTATNGLVRGCNSTIIPESVTSVAESAFSGCTGLVEINIPKSITSLGRWAFSGCSKLCNVVSYIKRPFAVASVFDSSTLETATLTIPYGCAKLYQKAQGWEFQTIKEMEGAEEDITYIQFADSLTKDVCVKRWDITGDGEISLYEASLVTSVNFEGNSSIISFDELQYFTNITSIKDYAFRNCTALSSITLPCNIMSIGERAFENCNSLKTITMADSVTTIGERAFLGCASLKSVYIPDNISSIGEYAFAVCTSLELFDIPRNVKTISEGLLRDCSSLKAVLLPEGVISIDQYAFAGCSSLTSISLPEGLKSIGAYAFKGSGLSEIVLPSSLTSIGYYALAGKTIYCKLTEPISVGTDIAYNASDVVLYVPQGCEQAFQNAEGWKNFIIMAENTGNTDWNEGQIEVTVESPGQLRLALIELDEEEIYRLKICGSLNSTDIAYLIEGKGKIARLESLDLSDVTLTYDGGCYRSDVFDGISDTGFESETYYFYLTEESSEKHNKILGIAPAYYHYYYGPNLAGAFKGLPYKHIVMPRNIDKAAHSTFRQCPNLQSVEFPAGLTTIDAQAFMGCERLMSIDLSQVDTIGESAFRDCKVLTTVNLENVKSLKGSAFYRCSHLIGENDVLSLPLIDSIPRQAFLGCSSLKQVHFSENLYYLGDDAFYYCEHLSSVDLPSTLRCLSEETFAGCGLLKEVTHSDDLLKVHYTSFDGTPWKNNLPIEGGVKYMGNIALCVDNISDFTSLRDGTTSIADCFMKSGSAGLTSLSFPVSLRRIGDKAFSNNNLESLILPIGLEQIGEEAFYGSKQLMKVTLNEFLTEVGNSAFGNCNLLSVVNYNTVELKAEKIFEDCESLEKVNIGAQVKELPESIFEGCSNLTIVKFAERTDGTPLAIGPSAFSDCSNLLKIDLPAATTEIGQEAFQGCTSLNSFVVPLNVETLNERVFSNCTALNSLQLHDNIKIIGDGAFYGCYQIPSFDLPEGLDSIGQNAFNSCYLLKELTIPGSVTRLGDAFVGDCYNLTKLVSRIKHPNGLSSIIPMSNTIIQEVFGYYYNWSAYRDIHYDNVTLTVPAGSRTHYRQADGWKKFANIIQDGVDITENNRLFVLGDTINKGESAKLAISLSNDIENFTAYQFDLIVPLSFTIETDVDGIYKVIKGNRYDESHAIIIEKLADHQYAEVNTYRVVCISSQNAPIKGTEGNLLEVLLHAHENSEVGDYDAELANIIFTQTNGQENELLQVKFDITVTLPTIITYGDTNGDGIINVSDIVSVINYIMEQPEGAFNKEAADVNQDGDINVSDVVEMINLIMKNGI
ncbi:MAG: leucine-rich repeat protein [Bacteroidaceae bacterium]|nr:leucine-rich repeat protein [Bacteroidaceae bacterium]